MQTDRINISQSKIIKDTIWSPDKSEYDIGTLVDGKQTGKWLHYYKQDTSRYEERYFTSTQDVAKIMYFRNGRLYLEENFLSDGIFSASYYQNGCINSFGYHRTVDGIQGEQDGLWKNYDSLGVLMSETIYDYSKNTIYFKKYNNKYLEKECEYYQDSGESTLYKNGEWKYYKNGKLERTEKHNMEATVDEPGK